MMTFWFRLIITGLTDFSDDQLDALDHAGCGDAIGGRTWVDLARTTPILHLDFRRSGDTRSQAVNLAVKQVESVGLEVLRVQTFPAKGPP